MTTDEALDAFYLNSVTIAGLVGKFGVKVREQANGTPHARCDLVVKEHGFDDKIRTVYVAVEAWGKAAAQMSGLHAGQAALVEGKIARAKRAAKDPQAGDDWYTTVQAWRVQAVEAEEDTHA